MQRQFLYSTVLAGVLGLSTLGLFYNGAQALDLGDFTGADQKVITQQAPQAGGIVLIKEDVIQPVPQRQMSVRGNGPILTATTSLNTGSNTGANLNAVAPAAGNPNIDAASDITLRPGNAYDQTRARLSAPGSAQPPVDGKPLVTTTAANGARVESLNDIVPAAGGSLAPAPLPTLKQNISTGASVQDMTGHKGSNAKVDGYNN